MSDTEAEPLVTRRPALLTMEKVMELHSRLDLLAQKMEGFNRVLDAVAALERRILTQELSVPAGALLTLQAKVHELELVNARSAQSGSTWKEALTWFNTGLLLLFAAIGAYLALKPH